MTWNERRFIVEYDSAVAIRYHGRRKAFLDGLARVSTALSLILGSVGFTTAVINWREATIWAAAAVAVFSALNLAFGWGDRARLHEKLFREWCLLNGRVAALDYEDEDALRRLEIDRSTIDADSPNQIYALSAICENEEKAVRRSGEQVQIGWLQRVLAQWFTLPGYVGKPIETNG